MIEIEYDQEKKEKTLEERGLDFAMAKSVFSGETLDKEDIRKDYGEKRIISLGLLDKCLVVIVWTPRGNVRRIISMRKANERERAEFSKYLG